MSAPDVEHHHAHQHVCSSTEFTVFAESGIEQSLCARFEAQVVLHRSCLAVRDSRTSLTYGELDGWANGIAAAVLDRGGDDDDPVPLVFAQGSTSTAAILGTLKSGRPYVSLEPGDPRNAQIVDGVDASVVLTDVEHRDAARAAAGDRPVVVVDAIGPADDPGMETTPDSLAYVFFTSGSTGHPKGVYDTHRNVLHNVLRYTNTLEIAPTDRLSLLQSPSFSGTVSSLFSALLNGAAVFPFRLGEEGVGRLAGLVRDERITIYHSVPAIFRALLRNDAESFPGVRVVRLEGDRASSLDVELHRRHFGGGCVLVNGLGLTEAGLVRQLFVDDQLAIEHGFLPVGYPVRDMEVLILDENAREVLPGNPGEIAVRSRRLALGYWNEPELTSQRFLEAGDARTYLTGDLGRIRDDGCLEYLGRRDGDLKILGNRVEPAAVEAELVRLPGVKEAAVVIREGRRGEGRLAAFVVTADDHTLAAGDVRAMLAQRLPGYMVPSTVSTIDELPVGTNGKVDRRALPDVRNSVGVRPLADELERLVARAWEEVFEVRPVHADDDFFALGGDSLAAAEILSCLEHETGTSLPVSVFTGSPTVTGLAEALRAAPTSAQSPLVVVRSGGDRAPLVLVHGNTGNLLHYSDLVPLLDRDRPVWGLEHAETLDLSLDAIAARDARVLTEANPSGPFLLIGFCFGAVVAHEVACRLRAEGHEVSLLALLGVTPSEFAMLLPPRVLDRWRAAPPSRSPGLLAQIRHHVARGWARPIRERPRYFARRGVNVVDRTRRRIGLGSSRPLSPYESLQRALAAHRPATYPGTALVVLHENETAVYTEDPERDWAALAERIDLEVLPGGDHSMLEFPGIVRLGELIEFRLAPLP